MVRIYLQKKSKLLGKLVTVVTVIYPLTAIPQIVKIWYHKDVSGVSFLTWLLFLILIIPLILYAIMKEEWKLALMWSAWIIVYIIILSGIMMYS
jgi:uncharacterized protein with PQ loop repeat